MELSLPLWEAPGCKEASAGPRGHHPTEPQGLMRPPCPYSTGRWTQWETRTATTGANLGTETRERLGFPSSECPDTTAKQNEDEIKNNKDESNLLS